MSFEKWWASKHKFSSTPDANELAKSIAQQAYQAGEKDRKDAVIDQLVTLHIYQAKHDADPRLAVKDTIDYHVQIALDPQVSSDAAALVQAGRDAMKAEPMKDAEALQLWHSVHEQYHGSGWNYLAIKFAHAIEQHHGIKS